ncbi:MAG: hypothetical protein DMF84_28850 [Acidobacteria bacterium]|nr:MAG: hypothetical protein DMF84_28850 [Acidobacteriota bacterium]
MGESALRDRKYSQGTRGNAWTPILASSTGQFFEGLIDEVRVYSRALSAAEIVTDMNTQSCASQPHRSRPSGRDWFRNAQARRSARGPADFLLCGGYRQNREVKFHERCAPSYHLRGRLRRSSLPGLQPRTECRDFVTDHRAFRRQGAVRGRPGGSGADRHHDRAVVDG